MPRFSQAVFERGIFVQGVLSGSFLARNFPYKTTNANFGVDGIYLPAQKYWFAYGANAGTDTVGWASPDGANWSSLGSTGLLSFNPAATRGASLVVNGNRILLAGNPVGSSADKMRTSVDGGLTWSSVTVGAADAEYTKSVAYYNGNYYAGFSTFARIFRSADGVTGWTSVYNSGVSGNLVGSLYVTPSRIFSTTENVANYVSSPTGDSGSWTTQVAPWSFEMNGLIYSPTLGKYYVAASPSVWESTTGLTGSWTPVFTQAGAAIENILDLNGVLIATVQSGGYLRWYQSLNGTTWQQFSMSPQGVSQLVIRTATRQGDPYINQIVAFDGSGNSYASLAG